jgi:hypothetical protein
MCTSLVYKLCYYYLTLIHWPIGCMWSYLIILNKQQSLVKIGVFNTVRLTLQNWRKEAKSNGEGGQIGVDMDRLPDFRRLPS